MQSKKKIQSIQSLIDWVTFEQEISVLAMGIDMWGRAAQASTIS